MILVLAGTVEGRQLALALQGEGHQLVASVCTPYGRDLMLKSGVKQVRQGALEFQELFALLKKGGFRLIVDATHPYAVTISRYSMVAAQRLGIPYLRLERAFQVLPQDDLICCIDTLEQLPAFLYPGCRILSTIGSKNLARLAELTAVKKAELVARVLPASQLIQKCEEIGLAPGNIIAMKGPFSMEMNRVLYKKYRIEVVLSKESGLEGGFMEKLQAAQELSIPMVVLTRPKLDYPLVCSSIEAVLAHVDAKAIAGNVYR